MILTALTALFNIWAGKTDGSVMGRLVPTFFILGFANFLIWAPLMAYRFLAKIGSS